MTAKTNADETRRVIGGALESESFSKKAGRITWRYWIELSG